MAKAKVFKEKFEAKLEFPQGEGALTKKPKSPLGEG